MKFGIVCCCLLVFHAVTFGQVNAPLYSDTIFEQNRLNVTGNMEWGSNAFRRELTQTLLFGGTVDNAMKMRSFDAHIGVNRIGFQTANCIQYLYGKGKIGKRDSLTWGVQAGYYGVGAASYGKDVFGLAFFGNSAYLANTARFDNTNLNVTVFQKIGFGISSKKSGSSLFLNMVNIQDQMDVAVRKGSLTQNEDASEVNLLMRGDFKTTNGNQFSKGFGFALDLDYRISVPWLKNEFTQIQVSVQNMGLAYMYAGQNQYSIDSNYHYSGFQLNAFTQNKPLFGSDFSLLDSLGIQHAVKKTWVKLPGYIQVMKMLDPYSAKRVQSFFGIRLYPTLSIVPSVFAGIATRVGSHFTTSASLSYGGFSNFKGGIYATFNRSNLSVTVGSDDIWGMISKQGFGQSILMRLSWKF
jgi:hypothetical protein